MGKPSSSKLQINHSEHSMKCNATKHKVSVMMTTKKSNILKMKNHKKTKRKISRLFDNLRSSIGQENTIDVSENEAVISLDGSAMQNDVITIEPPAKKRKCESSVIIVTDDELVINHDPCHMNSPKRMNSCMNSPKCNSRINCSTPISKTDSKAIQNLIIDNFSSKTNNNTNKIQNFNEDIINLTKEINRDSYLTIDLTNETDKTNVTQNTVIDLDNLGESGFRTAESNLFVSISNTSLSMSGDSDVTVLNIKNKKNKNKEMKKFASCIGKLNPSDKGKLLELIAQKIFTGCNVPSNLKESLVDAKRVTRATETAEDTYIKETILGEARSRNSIGSNIYNPGNDPRNKTGLRMVVIDGSNVALEHTKGKTFSVKGLQICIDYFVRRGHVVKAFVPRFRCKFGKSSDPRLLDSLERRGLVVYTPAREIHGKNIVPYDDRYIVQCAAEFDAVIVSGDNYRDLMGENPRWRSVIENRVLPFTWVNDMIMFPRDPLGRNGPTLEQFLKHPTPTPSASRTNSVLNNGGGKRL